MESDQLYYLYGIVPGDAPDPPPELRGLEGRSVRLVRSGPVAAVAGTVPASDYSDAALEARLGELAWVGERGVAHERVLDWYMERGPIVPLSLFSLHHDEARVRARLEAETERLAPLLERLRGRREWGIKLWRVDEELARHLDQLSPTLRAIAAEMETAPEGRRFLLSKKREEVRAEELRSLSKKVAHQTFVMVREAAERASSIPLPQVAPEGGKALLLHAAFLVPDAELPAFQRRVGEVAREFGGVGFEVEFTGPWPPYHFVEADAG